MKPVDAITKYIEALATGQSQEQAKLFATSWAQSMEAHPETASKHELEMSIEKVNSTIGKLYLLTLSIFLILAAEVLKGWFLKG